MYQVISGGVMAACWVLAFFFTRFLRKTKDPLFAKFALAFALFGVDRVILGLRATPNEGDPSVYLIRLAGFLLILYAIFDKNRTSKP